MPTQFLAPIDFLKIPALSNELTRGPPELGQLLRLALSLAYPSALIIKKIKFSSYIRKFSGAVAKSYIRKGFLKYEEMSKYFPIYEEAVSNTCI
jgi:hypothetical protein